MLLSWDEQTGLWDTLICGRLCMARRDSYHKGEKRVMEVGFSLGVSS